MSGSSLVPPLAFVLRFAATGFAIFALHAGLAGVHAAPFKPARDSEVLETLRAPDDAEGRALRGLRDRLAETPQDLTLAVRLARGYLRRHRTQGDPRTLGYARAALAPWWSLADPPVDVLLLRATLRQRRHDFTGALTDLDRALEMRPRSPGAWLTRALILRVQGRRDEARRSCARLPRSTTSLIATACLAAVRSLSGQAADAYRHLAQELAMTSGTDPRLRRWVLTILAEMAAALGKPEAAERHFLDASALGRRDAYLLGAYADFLLDQGRPAEARDLLKDETRSDSLLLRLALAERLLGDPALARRVDLLAARFEAGRRRGEALHLREEARFALHLLNQPKRALSLALANWSIQREPWDARLVLESALAADAPDAAAPVVAWLANPRLEHVHLQRLVRQVEERAR